MDEDCSRYVSNQLGLRLERNVPLAQHSSIKVGGCAECFVTVDRSEDLRQLIRWAHTSGTPFYLLGGGTNTLFADEGMSGMTIFNRCRHIQCTAMGSRVVLEADSGLLLAQCARCSMHRHLTGLEWAVSVPGTLGGAVVGNAGAHGSDIAGCLTEVELCQPSGHCGWVPAAELRMAYRHSSLKAGGPVRAALNPVIVSVRLHLHRGDVAEIQAQARQFLRHRRNTQPTAPSVGSVFRNPPGQFAGELIEAAGCKGLTCGAMAVSEQHANFIIRQPGQAQGRARDVLSLIQTVRQRVLDHAGVLLQPEIGLAGEWPPHTTLA